jgi:hypothetical protein
LAVLLVCAAPVLASYLTYYVIRPEARGNYGELIEPQRPWPEPEPDRAIVDRSGRPVGAERLRGNWLLVTVSIDGPCAADCRQRLYWTRQLRTAQGKERDRIDRLLILPPGLQPPSDLLDEHPGLAVVHASAAVLRAWLPPATAPDAATFLLDPQANLMMRWPGDADPNRIKRDLSRLLRASVHWQTPRPPRL